ncbi:DMT family transporter [Sediminispirochaeta bajacaliforniensis]|uniref:DMT family transporter n=1 Tax=Sediminispirochaeta bajacaliforniensis TaxID=148 RepID=UPI00036FC5D8|nr:DMT family transporter [Sediminispirochaeta bajacaliforniensis]
MEQREHRTPAATKGVLQVLFAALLWSTSGVVVRGIKTLPFIYLLYRNSLTAAILWPFCGGHKLKQIRSAWKPLVVVSLSYSLYVGGFVIATRLLGAATAIAMQYTAPVYLFIFYLFRNRYISIRQEYPKLLMLCGVVMNAIATIRDFSFPMLLPAFCCGIGFALFTRAMKRLADLDTFFVVAVVNAASALVFFLLAHPYDNYHVLLITKDELFIIFFASVTVNVVSYILFGLGIKSISSLEASCITLIEPVMNPLWVLLILGEAPSLTDVLFLLIIIVSLLLEVVLVFRHDNHQYS